MWFSVSEVMWELSGSYRDTPISARWFEGMFASYQEKIFFVEDVFWVWRQIAKQKVIQLMLLQWQRSAPVNVRVRHGEIKGRWCWLRARCPPPPPHWLLQCACRLFVTFVLILNVSHLQITPKPALHFTGTLTEHISSVKPIRQKVLRCAFHTQTDICGIMREDVKAILIVKKNTLNLIETAAQWVCLSVNAPSGWFIWKETGCEHLK